MAENESDFVEPKPISEQQQSERSVKATFTASIETPFLPPQFIAEYDKIVPNAGKMILDMVLEQQKFNMEMKRKEIELHEKNLESSIQINQANIAEQQAAAKVRQQEVDIKARGQVFAMILAIGFMCLSVLFAWLGYVWLAGITLTVLLGAMTVIFLQKAYKAEKTDSE